MEERRRIPRIVAPKVSIAAVTDNTMSAAIGRKILFGRIRDINNEAMCASLDVELPPGKNIDIIVRLFKQDLKFRGEIIRSDKTGELIFVAFKFDWKNTPEISKENLQKYLEVA